MRHHAPLHHAPLHHAPLRHAPLVILLTGALLGGCAQRQQTAVNPYPPVPPLIQEEMSKPPVTAEPLIWQPGHWDWSGNGYVWARGQFVPAEGHGNLWMPGWWALTPAGWIWQPPHWTS